MSNDKKLEFCDKVDFRKFYGVCSIFEWFLSQNSLNFGNFSILKHHGTIKNYQKRGLEVKMGA